tara:strand:+ start:3163 stop:3723 length:561 start_codon:yes stop_codon:yes gene_type:complete
MKRLFDLILCVILLLILVIPMLLIALSIAISSEGPILYWSNRVGRRNIIFKMPKFRTMKINTPSLPSHLMQNPEEYLTPIGIFLRRYSMDELPQLFSILIGDMSFVGPRPALFNQDDLISLRTKHNIDSLIPGLTGWAQVNGRDQISIAEKVRFDLEYLKKKSFTFDLKIFWMTFFKVLGSSNVSH